MTPYQTFIALSRYARWKPELGRRETWTETVDRYISYLQENIGTRNGTIPYDLLRSYILSLDVMPSMRALMSAGEALDRDNTAAYNCSYLPVDHPVAFDEALYILMNGTGVGFSVEEEFVSKLPPVPKHFLDDAGMDVVVVEDSKEGWGRGFRQVLSNLWAGRIPIWNLSKVRPAGERLKTFGGRASGPGPLDELFRFVVEIFKAAAGRRLTSLECHDIMCKIGQVVVVGGVRRSALISLSDLSDAQMAGAKAGMWWDANPQRALANNSVCYTGRPDEDDFWAEWKSLRESGSGERGMFNREAANNVVLRNGRREGGHLWGTNPCSEIILRPYQFCNLTEVVVREDDNEEELHKKVSLATTLGTLQSCLTHFPYLRDVWKHNTEQERLLGVSLTGILDSHLFRDEKTRTGLMDRLRTTAVRTNEVIADTLEIPRSAAITCVKPSGTVSQLVDSASGCHPRYSRYYVRTVRGDVKDPLSKLMKDLGVPSEPCVMKPDNTVVFSFPQKAPDSAVLRDDISCLDHLKLWLDLSEHWCEHKPSVTIYVKENEWDAVGDFVWSHFDKLSGVSFLPYSDHTYQQAPYQEINKETYLHLVEEFPKTLDWSLLGKYELTDHTSGAQTLACSGDYCEVVDITQ